MAAPETVTIQQAAKILQVCEKTVRRRIADGTIPHRRLGERVILIRASDLDKLFDKAS